MTAGLHLLIATGPEETALRFRALPPLWLLFMVLLPAAAVFVWWIYRREAESAPPGAKRLLSALRFAALAFVLLLLFQPYAETSVRRLVKSHLVVLLDTSASMEFRDAYGDRAREAEMREAALLAGESPSALSRLALVKRVLGNEEARILDRLAEQFHLHLYTFAERPELLAAAAEGFDSPETRRALAARIAELRGEGPVTFLGTAVSEVLDEFRLRDEPLAGVVVFTDGRQTGGTVGALEAARKAGGMQPRVPLYLVAAGDPDRPRNVHVANLRAKEVVLRGDDVTFEFTVSHRGYAGEMVSARISVLPPDGGAPEDLPARGGDVLLGEEDTEQVVRLTHKFERPGSYTLSIGIPVRPGEKIEADNALTHRLRVVDKKIKVLFADGYPRWEYRYLKNSLVRDTETVLAHCLNLDADPEGAVQPMSPGLAPRQRFPTAKEEIFDYDVIVFGDVDWTRLGKDEVESKRILEHIREFVEEGGGFIMIAGPYDSPRSYQNTPLAAVLPVTLSVDEERRSPADGTRSFNMVLTEEGRRHPVMMLEDDPDLSRQIWEKDRFSGQFWYYPVERAKPTATVLARHPGEYSDNRNKYGPHVLVATMNYGAGRSLFVGVDELWRLRFCFGDRYHYRFYGEALRTLATYRLLGGNKRFKIFTDRNTYFVGDTVTVSAEVFDQEFNPSREESQTVVVRAPDGSEQPLALRAVAGDPGNYAQRMTVHKEGTWLVTATPPSGDEERPERLFKVEFSTEEMKNPLVDLPALAEMARECGGEAIPLSRAASLPGAIPARSVFVSSEVRSEDLWDEPWVPIVFTLLLAAEWLVRKRYRLL